MGSCLSLFFPKKDASVTAHNDGVEAWERYQTSRNKADLDKAIASHTRALELRPAGPPSHADRHISLFCLAVASWAQYETEGITKENSDTVIKLCEESLQLSASNPDPMLYDKLGQIYLFRFVYLGRDPEDLKMAVKNYGDVLRRRPNRDAGRVKALINLSLAYIQDNQMATLTGAIDHLQEAVEICTPKESPAHQYRSNSMICLASAYNARFTLMGNLPDLRNVIETSEAALPYVDGPSRASALINVSNAIWTLAEHEPTGHVDDLEKAIRYSRESLQLTENNAVLHTQARLTLANALVSRDSRIPGGDVRGLDEAIGEYRETLKTGESKNPVTLSSLSNAICIRCEKHGDRLDQDITYEMSITYNDEALQYCEAGELKAKIANNIASTYITQYNLSARLEDLRNGIQYYHKAVEGCVNDGDDKVYYLERIKEGEKTLASLHAVKGPETTHHSLIVRRQSTTERKGSMMSQAGDTQPNPIV